MRRRLSTWGRRRPLQAAVLALCALAIAGVAAKHTVGFVRWTDFASRAEAINACEGTRLSCVSWTFPFRDGNVTVTARLDARELAAAEALDTEDVFTTSGWLRERYVSHLVEAQSRSPFVNRLAQEFRRLRGELGLDDDGHLELMAAAIQAIPYGEVTREIQLPTQMVAYRSGVCTEKSLLLAALMAHEGWDSSMWVFDSQRHVAVGVASEACTFQDSRYAFIETTEPAFVGESRVGYRSRGPVARPPQLIVLGGERSYGSGAEVAYILGVLELAETGNVRLEQYHQYVDGGTGALGERYAEYADAQEQASALESFIHENAHDRPGVYRALLAQGVGRDLSEVLTPASATYE